MPETIPTITVLDGGPLLVKGTVDVVDQQGENLQAPDPCALCRCGRSEAKPFCDGSHAKGAPS